MDAVEWTLLQIPCQLGTEDSFCHPPCGMLGCMCVGEGRGVKSGGGLQGISTRSRMICAILSLRTCEGRKEGSSDSMPAHMAVFESAEERIIIAGVVTKGRGGGMDHLLASLRDTIRHDAPPERLHQVCHEPAELAGTVKGEKERRTKWERKRVLGCEREEECTRRKQEGREVLRNHRKDNLS